MEMPTSENIVRAMANVADREELVRNYLDSVSKLEDSQQIFKNLLNYCNNIANKLNVDRHMNHGISKQLPQKEKDSFIDVLLSSIDLIYQDSIFGLKILLDQPMNPKELKYWETMHEKPKDVFSDEEMEDDGEEEVDIDSEPVVPKTEGEAEIIDIHPTGDGKK